MIFRRKLFVTSLIATVVGIASVAWLFSTSQAHQNTQTAPGQSAALSTEPTITPADQAASTASQSQTATGQNQSGYTSQRNNQATISDPTNVLTGNPSPTFKGVQLDPSLREFLQSLRAAGELKDFTDVQLNSPYYDSTLLLQLAGIFNGFPNGSAGLNQSLSRAQAAAILNRTFLISVFVPSSTAFNDVPAGSSHDVAINALYWAGITNGCSASPRNYCPTQAITRRQFAVLLGKTLGLQPPVKSYWAYNDVPASDGGYTYIYDLKQLGIMNGCGNNNFCPDQPLSRGQAVTIMARVLYGSELTPNPTL